MAGGGGVGEIVGVGEFEGLGVGETVGVGVADAPGVGDIDGVGVLVGAFVGVTCNAISVGLGVLDSKLEHATKLVKRPKGRINLNIR